jgi:CheY-like chemotaxis protein
MTAPMRPTDILLIDDDHDVRFCLTRLLERAGYAVAGAESGQTALNALCQRGSSLPRLIILDVAMPGMDGNTFLIARRCLPRLARVPVVVFSGVAGLTTVNPRALGAEAVLEKPADFSKLLQVITAYLPSGPVARMA